MMTRPLVTHFDSRMPRKATQPRTSEMKMSSRLAIDPSSANHTGDVSGPAPGDDRGTECEFEDEIPCDDPGEDLTDRGVGVGIGTALRWELPLPVPHSRGQRGERRVLQ